MGRPSKYPEAFRREAVALALSSDDSRASVARRLGVNETTLRNWVADHLAEEARQADPLAVTASGFEELRRLRREVAELRTEREILRKAAAYFAQETIRSAASGSSPSTDTSTASSGSVGSWESRDRGSTPGSGGRPRRGRRARSPALATGRPDAVLAPDLVQRNFNPTGPDRLWAGDVTQFRTGEGWLHLAAVIDLWSRRVVGWAMGTTANAELVTDALVLAFERRRPDRRVVHHSDRGAAGGFRWSWQHLEMEVVRDGVQASAGGGDPGDAGEDVVAWAAFDGATRGSGSVLGGNRPRIVDRRCRRAGRRVIRGRGAVVPGVWRDAVTHVGPGVGPFLVLR